jgi:hypothetical protein
MRAGVDRSRTIHGDENEEDTSAGTAEEEECRTYHTDV